MFLRLFRRGPLAVMAIVCGLILAGCSIFLYSIWGIRATCETSRSFSMDIPLTTIIPKLAMDNPGPEIMERLGMKVISQKILSQSLNLSPTSFFTGNFGGEIVSEFVVEKNDPDLGLLSMCVIQTITCSPGKIISVSQLKEPVAPLKNFTQTLIIYPGIPQTAADATKNTNPSKEPVQDRTDDTQPKNQLLKGLFGVIKKNSVNSDQKIIPTVFEMKISSDIQLAYPDISLIRNIAENRMKETLDANLLEVENILRKKLQ